MDGFIISHDSAIFKFSGFIYCPMHLIFTSHIAHPLKHSVSASVTMELQILFILLLCASSLADLSAEYKNKDTLDGDNYKVYWTHNSTSNMMYIALEVKATGWAALAFAKEKSSSMKNYDACIGYVSGETKMMKVSLLGLICFPLSVSSTRSRTKSKKLLSLHVNLTA